jgi:hypothetical protein
MFYNLKHTNMDYFYKCNFVLDTETEKNVSKEFSYVISHGASQRSESDLTFALSHFYEKLQSEMSGGFKVTKRAVAVNGELIEECFF